MRINEDVEILRGDTLALAFEWLGDLTGHTKLWFTVKDDRDDADAAAVLQIEETAGLVYINGAAAGTPVNGDITVGTIIAGHITVELEAVESAKLPMIGRFHYDIQALFPLGVVTTLSRGRVHISGDVTRTTS